MDKKIEKKLNHSIQGIVCLTASCIYSFTSFTKVPTEGNYYFRNRRGFNEKI